MLENLAYYVLVGAAGAAAGEVFKVYEYKSKLSNKTYKQLARSPLFWLVVVGMILGSGFIAWAVNATASTPTPLQLVFSGLGARSLARGSLTVAASERSVSLGDEEHKSKITLKDLS